MKKGIFLCAALLLTIGLMPSCKHDTQWCNGKEITIDTVINSSIVYNSTVDTTTRPITYGSIFIDTINDHNYAFVKANIISKPYYGSIDGGKTWAKLPITDTTLSVGVYKVIIKDGNGCESQVYTQKITY